MESGRRKLLAKMKALSYAQEVALIEALSPLASN